MYKDTNIFSKKYENNCKKRINHKISRYLTINIYNSYYSALKKDRKDSRKQKLSYYTVKV